MLTLRELKKMIQTPEKNEKIPTDKLLKERKIPVVVSKKIGNGERMALVTVYSEWVCDVSDSRKGNCFSSE